MNMPTTAGRRLFVALALCLWAAAGCHAVDFYTPAMDGSTPPELAMPCELSKVSLPAYRIEPPDMVRLEVLKLVPRSTYRIDAHDVLKIRACNVLLQQPIDDFFLVEGDGIVTLPPAYGVVRVEGLTMEEAAAAITKSLRQFLRNPIVTVQLIRSAATKDISADYQVAPDGTITISHFGAVPLAGKTVTEARLAIQEHLSQYFDSPTVGVAMSGYNSKAYYIITAGTFAGESIQRYPITGNETVLDALCQIKDEKAIKVTSKTMWVARPTPGRAGEEEILPVDWEAIARGGIAKTNYQLMPGDRLYLVDDSLVAMNSYVTVLTAPIQRLLSITSLGASTVRDTQTLGRAYNQTRR